MCAARRAVHGGGGSRGASRTDSPRQPKANQFSSSSSGGDSAGSPLRAGRGGAGRQAAAAVAAAAPSSLRGGGGSGGGCDSSTGEARRPGDRAGAGGLPPDREEARAEPATLGGLSELQFELVLWGHLLLYLLVQNQLVYQTGLFNMNYHVVRPGFAPPPPLALAPRLRTRQRCCSPERTCVRASWTRANGGTPLRVFEGARSLRKEGGGIRFENLVVAFRCSDNPCTGRGGTETDKQGGRCFWRPHMKVKTGAGSGGVARGTRRPGKEGGGGHSLHSYEMISYKPVTLVAAVLARRVVACSFRRHRHVATGGNAHSTAGSSAPSGWLARLRRAGLARRPGDRAGAGGLPPDREEARAEPATLGGLSELQFELVLWGHLLLYLLVQNQLVYQTGLFNMNYHVVTLVAAVLARRVVACSFRRHRHVATGGNAHSTAGSSAPSGWLARLRRAGLTVAAVVTVGAALDAAVVLAQDPGPQFRRYLLAPLLLYALLVTATRHRHAPALLPPPGIHASAVSTSPQSLRRTCSASNLGSPRKAQGGGSFSSSPLSDHRGPSLDRRHSSKGAAHGHGHGDAAHSAAQAASGGGGGGGRGAGAGGGMDGQIKRLRRRPWQILTGIAAEVVLDAYLVGVVPLKMLQVRPAKLRGDDGGARDGAVRGPPRPGGVQARLLALDAAAAWSARAVPYGEGAVVEHRGRLYAALGSCVYAHPSSTPAVLLFMVHETPQLVHNWLIAVQVLTAVSQMFLLMHAAWWKNAFLLAVMTHHVLYICIVSRNQK
eukprot:jgi/Mesen1/4938/ME000247S04223